MPGTERSLGQELDSFFVFPLSRRIAVRRPVLLLVLVVEWTVAWPFSKVLLALAETSKAECSKHTVVEVDTQMSSVR